MANDCGSAILSEYRHVGTQTSLGLRNKRLPSRYLPQIPIQTGPIAFRRRVQEIYSYSNKKLLQFNRSVAPQGSRTIAKLWKVSLSYRCLSFRDKSRNFILSHGNRNQRGGIKMTKTKNKDASEAETSTASKRVLIVDDDAEIIDTLRYALEAKGLKVMIARDGNQGLALAEREDPDLMILDMMMPKRSGFLVLEKLRRTRPVQMRVIMITANEGSRHKAYAEMLGVDDYIRKPFAIDRLMATVERLLT